jgi:4'-phosphopantetheinyl transferase
MLLQVQLNFMNPQVIQVFYTEHIKSLQQDCFDFYRNRLPASEQIKIGKYKRREDRESALLGKALLMEGMRELGIEADWTQLKRNAYGKPYLDLTGSNATFNISHSGHYVVTAISHEAAVGIDIEAIQPLNTTDFETCFSASEWQTITESENMLQQFFTFWSIKEAVIKAIGKGLSIPLSDVIIGDGSALVYGDRYFFKKITIHEHYSLVVAAPRPFYTDIILQDYTHRFNWDELHVNTEHNI